MTLRALLITTIAALSVAVIVSPTASALSCARPDLEQSMERAKASDKLYYILVGTFETSNLQKPSPQSERYPYELPKGQIVTAWFNGYVLGQTRRADSPPTRFPVTIKTTCAASWCGAVPNAQQTKIAFVEDQPGQAPLLEISPCPGMVFNLEPQKRQISRLRDCFDKACVAKTY